MIKRKPRSVHVLAGYTIILNQTKPRNGPQLEHLIKGTNHLA